MQLKQCILLAKKFKERFFQIKISMTWTEVIPTFEFFQGNTLIMSVAMLSVPIAQRSKTQT